ncbi:MAG: DUF1566 domain-containing protein [Deltaproteobacteria bacterium]|nr:DUF1566 domain-containing protein [Deltaproteobacteria bacterium]
MTVPRSITITVWVFFVLFCAGLAAKGLLALSENKGSNAEHNYALIIGISSYDKWTSLKSPSKDAREIARILAEKYDFKKENIALLTDETKKKPNLVTILSLLDQYINDLTEQDNLLVFFSGQSTEDEKGETYWIPKDGSKKAKKTWLKHSDLCKNFFASQHFKAKSVCIISDSMFSHKLVKSSAITLSPFDLRYPEKIREKALSGSREVIAFGDRHWPGTKRTDGFGLFTYYFRKALLNNWLKVVDIENLIFTEKAIFETSKIAGTRLLRARLRKARLEKGGQFIITRVISPPVVDVVDINVSPKKGYQGDDFIFQAKTSDSAFEVYVDVGGREHLMEGAGTRWKKAIKIASLGPSRFRIIARNSDDIKGKAKEDQLSTMRRVANLVNVKDARVTPKRGWGGNNFRFRATMDGPAQKASLIMGGKRFEMMGSGTKWNLTKRVEEVGTLDFSVIATNEDGADGRSKGGILVVKAPLVDIVDVKAAPATGYSGDEFLISAKSDRPASAVSLKIDGVTYRMEGSGLKWQFKRSIKGIGKKKFVVIAKNIEGSEGLSKSGDILTSKRPLVIPNVAGVSVSPKKPYTDQTFAIRVKTTAPADEVFVEIEGKKHVMEGTGTEWKYLTRLANIGTSTYKVVAKNSEGKPGLSKSGSILTRKRLLPLPNVAEISVNPKRPYTEETFAIRVKTTAPADEVYVELKGKKLLMKGEDTEWEYLTRLATIGPNKFRVIAKNKDGKQGLTKDGLVSIAKRITEAIDVVRADVVPKKGYPGQEYMFEATTATPAKSVALIVEDKRYNMTGSGTRWSLKKKVKDLGTISYAMVAKNEDGIEGGSRIGTLHIKARSVSIVEVKASPKTGYAGDAFMINVKTDNPASAVSLEIDGVTYKMKGAGRKWVFKRKIQEVGKKKFTIIAKNLEGVAGLAKSADILTKKRLLTIPDVASVDVRVVSPGKGYTGDSYLIKAVTKEPADEAYIEIEGKKFAMKGAGTKWEHTAKIDKLGANKYTVVALNREGKQGLPKSGNILTKKRPLPIPDVASVDVSVVSPVEGYVGDSYLIKVSTAEPADRVTVELEGKKFSMEGAGTEWKYLTQLNKLGISKYTVVAVNKEGRQGLAKQGEIKTAMRPMALINVAKAEVTPVKGYAGKEFTFTAGTDSPAKGVSLVMGKERYEMTGSGTEWTLKKKIEKTGDLVFYMVAKNEDGVEGGSKTAELTVAEIKNRYSRNKDGTITDVITGEVKKRFIDNGDGTITDLYSNLMWLKSPKQVAVKYDDAIEYCEKLKLKDYEGWRLPTVQEWRAIMDKTRKNPSLPPGHPFVNIPTQTGYWSKTKHKFGPLYVWQVTLWYGKAGYLSKRKYGNVWPVRYAEFSK